MQSKRTIGNRVRAFRKAKGMTQDALGERVGRTGQSISKFERGEVIPSLSLIEEIAAVLEVPVMDFFRESGAASTQQADADFAGCLAALHALPPERLKTARDLLEALNK